MTHRNGFLLFISSCLSGCGQMYQGYMKRGLSLLLAFCLILFASTYFFLGALALFLPVIWLSGTGFGTSVVRATLFAHSTVFFTGASVSSAEAAHRVPSIVPHSTDAVSPANSFCNMIFPP